jgi:hypothetical protein
MMSLTQGVELDLVLTIALGSFLFFITMAQLTKRRPESTK